MPMKLLCTADLHSRSEAFGQILADAAAVDLILFGGDITHFGSADDAESLVRQAEATGAAVLAVAGNCDNAEIDRRLTELGVSVNGCGWVHDGLGIHGLSGIPPWNSRMYQFSEDELAERLAAGRLQVDAAERRAVLAHVPPYGGRLDRVAMLKHAGSRALREFVDRQQPELVVCGHVHEARGIEQFGRTTVVNCGPAAAGYYALVDFGREVQVELCRA